MYEPYHDAIVDAQFERLRQRVQADGWTDTVVARDRSLIYAEISASLPHPHEYVVKIDMGSYPVEPYWIGFLNPGLSRTHWATASDSDPRYWPWSPMPGLHGSFVLAFLGPYRTFWCRECTVPFFVYHGDRQWDPAAWPVDRVVAYLREAVSQAEPPSRWRPLQQPALLIAAANAGVAIPADAGSGGK